MKIIEFGPTLFRLPDDFKGGVPEALRALADYYETGPTATSSQMPKRGRPSKATSAYDDFRSERRGAFFEAVDEGAQFDGRLVLMEGDANGLKEVDLDEGWK